MEESLRRMTRAVELAQRSPLLLAAHARLLALVGRRDEARALREEVATRARSTFVGPAVELFFCLALDDEESIAASLRRNIEAGTGPTSLAASGLERDLEPLLAHPRLGPLVRQLSLYAQRPGVPPLPTSA
jgi:hypothetical protein